MVKFKYHSITIIAIDHVQQMETTSIGRSKVNPFATVATLMYNGLILAGRFPVKVSVICLDRR